MEDLHHGLASTARYDVLIRDQGRIPGVGDLTLEQRAFEGEFQLRADVGLRTGVVERHDIGAGGDNFDIPDGGVGRFGPVHEVGRVRRLAAATHLAARFAVAGREYGDREFPIADRQRSRVDAAAGSIGGLTLTLTADGGRDAEFLAPGGDCIRQFLGEIRLFRLDRGGLTGVGDHVEKVAGVVESVRLRAHADVVGPRVKNITRRPISV